MSVTVKELTTGSIVVPVLEVLIVVPLLLVADTITPITLSASDAVVVYVDAVAPDILTPDLVY